MRKRAILICLALWGCGEHGSSPSPGQSAAPPSTSPAPFGSPEGGTSTDGATPEDPCKTHDCSNVVDAVMVPMFVEHGMTIAKETDSVLCRRMAIDLVGLVPTPDEQKTNCAGHSPREMATYFMNKPTGMQSAVDGSAPFPYIHRRAWLTAFNPSTSPDYSRDWDHMVSDVYSGVIGYDEFAIRALASPTLANLGILLTNHDLVKIAAQAYRMFLGREALPNEASDFGNLWRGWDIEVLDPGARQIVGLDSASCAGEKRVLCQSTILGPAEVVPSPQLPGHGVPGCVTPCRPTFTSYYDLGPSDLASLRLPGKLLVARPEFAEAAVDGVLSELLGWWKAGWYRPDYDLGPVRDALVKKFVSDHFDLRKLYLEIVTSILYTQSASRTAGQNASAPIWSVGPTKLLDRFKWLDILGQATQGAPLGYFDFTRVPGQFPSSKHWLYDETLSALSGFSGLVASMARRKMLGSGVCDGFHAKDGQTRTLDDVINLEFDALGRPPTSEEREIVTRNANMCVQQCSTNPGPTSRGIEFDLCASLFNTSTFNTY